MLIKMIVLLVLMLSVNAQAADVTKYTVGSKTIDSVLETMKVEEKLSLEKRYDNLRKQFLVKIAEALAKCPECKDDFPDTDKENLEDAANIYIKDLRERERLKSELESSGVGPR